MRLGVVVVVEVVVVVVVTVVALVRMIAEVVETVIAEGGFDVGELGFGDPQRHPHHQHPYHHP